MNISVYEQIFRIQSVSDDVLCLELRTRKPSTSWPECVAGGDFEGFDNEDSTVIDDIVSLGKNMSLEVNNEEMEELLEDNKD